MLDILCGYFQGKKNGYCQLFNKALSYIPHFMCYDDVNWWFLFFLFFCPLFFFFAMMIMVFLLSQSDSTMTIWDSTLFSSYVRKTLLASVSLYTLYYQDSDAFFFFISFFTFSIYYYFLQYACIYIHIYTRWWKMVPYIRSFHGSSTLANPSFSTAGDRSYWDLPRMSECIYVYIYICVGVYVYMLFLVYHGFVVSLCPGIVLGLNMLGGAFIYIVFCLFCKCSIGDCDHTYLCKKKKGIYL